MSKAILALYDDASAAHQAVSALVEKGVAREQISMVARDEERVIARREGDGERMDDTMEGMATGALLGGLTGLLAGLVALVLPGVGPVVAAGPIAAALAGTGVGAVTGGLFGALVELGVPEDEAGYYVERIKKGGFLIAVTPTDSMADEVVRILNLYDPVAIDERNDQ